MTSDFTFQVKQEVMSDDEKPSKTKHKKAKSERRRVLLENSSDEDEAVARKIGKHDNIDSEVKRFERSEKGS